MTAVTNPCDIATMGNGARRPAGMLANRWSRAVRVGSAAVALALVTGVPAAAPPAGSGDALRSAWTRIAESDGDMLAGAPVAVVSSQMSGALAGALHGVLEAPFGEVVRALAEPAAWCEVLILDPNIHLCRWHEEGTPSAPARLEIAFGQSSAPVVLDFARTAANDYLRVRLSAADGPFGTRDYAMTFEAAPLREGRSVVGLAFAQRYGLAARLALLAYFNTAGRGKVGFTVVERDAAGRAVRVGGLRGGVERNLVRQWLAIAAFLGTRNLAPIDIPEQRVRHWLAGTERFPLQLREARGYLARKAPEVRRQLAGE